LTDGRERSERAEYDSIQHHSVIVVGGGPGGLGAAAVLEGWHPRFTGEFQFPAPEVQQLADQYRDCPLELDQRRVLRAGLRPIEFYRMRHHPTQEALALDQWTLGFHRHPRVDWKMLALEQPGGLWNNVPREQLTLGPAHWMELAPYPMLRFYAETGRELDPDKLIHKSDVVPYYHAFAERLGLNEHIRTGTEVTSIRPMSEDAGPRFLIEAETDSGHHWYTCDYLVFGVGPKSLPRRLKATGGDQPYIQYSYHHADHLPGERVMVVGGGRSADWAATECHDAGKTVVYVMRQLPAPHLKLIDESQHLPYYRRLSEILDGDQKRIGLLYNSEAIEFRPDGEVVVGTPEGDITLNVDHVIVEIGGEPDYSLLQGFMPLSLVPKQDNFRFQLMQVQTDQATFESIDIPGLYPAGYLSQGTGLSVIGFHCGAYLMAGDILRRLGYFSRP
jgi:thioredoxin reductase